MQILHKRYAMLRNMGKLSTKKTDGSVDKLCIRFLSPSKPFCLPSNFGRKILFKQVLKTDRRPDKLLLKPCKHSF
jgi:hypothetical protein